jgi:protein gp37
MGDLFHKDVPDAWIDAVFHVTSIVHRHTYLILTKRPERMRNYINSIVDQYEIEIPSNLWFGVTVENQEMADFRLPILIDTKVTNKFVSIEPMLGPVDLTNYIDRINWVITGGETGMKARYMDPGWAIAVKNICVKNNLPFFFKQMSNKAPAPAELEFKQLPSGMPV